MSSSRLDRRTFLQSSAALSASFLAVGSSARAFQAAGEARISRSAAPICLETPLATLAQFQTPNNLHYVRNHFPVPTLTPDAWRLQVIGAVERDLTLSLDEIRRLPTRSVMMTMECAGNSRASLNPRVRGVQWDNGGISTTEWTGVPLAAILERAGLRNTAVDVVLEGSDRGEITSEPRSPGPIHYARSIPLAKARSEDVILAYRMGNADLPANNGFPLRAVIPGWYGMAAVKWLSRIVVSDRPYNGFFQSLDYSIYERPSELVTVTPLSSMVVKSLIIGPTANQRLAANSMQRVFGAAWAGENSVSRVDVSADGGRTWNQARLTGDARRYCWQMWEFPWRTPAAGRVGLMARATDANGSMQPMERDTARRGYMINHVQTVSVEIG